MVSINSCPIVPDLKLFVKDVRDLHGKKRPLMMRPWSTIKDVKDCLQKLLHIPPCSQRLYFGPLMINSLPNHRTLQDAGIYKSGETLLLDINGTVVSEGYSNVSLRPSSSDICVCSTMLDVTSRSLIRIVQKARRGFAMGLKPVLVLDGTGGTYFLHDARKAKVAVFKPGDEEPYAENNPRGYIRHVAVESYGSEEDVSMRSGIKPGESCIREVAAYLLDHRGFSGVPMTTLAEARHPGFNVNEGCQKPTKEGIGMQSLTVGPNNEMVKIGSLQEFVSSDCTMDDLSFSKLDVEEVHRIAILDIRILNADRNAANLLCHRNQDNSWSLTPIDHGYCLRSVCDVSWFDWCWLDWPQLKKPLSKKLRDYVLGLNIEADVSLLKERLNIRQEALDNFRASSKILMTGVKMGLTLHDIAQMCCRHDNAGVVRSKLENIMSRAAELSKIAVENGKWHHVAASNALAEQLYTSYNFDCLSPKRKSIVSLVPLNDNTQRMLTSGSESNSDVDDNFLYQDECETWAANIIADGLFEDSFSVDRSRTTSFGSNSSGFSDTSKFSSSPVGFWYVKPGSFMSSSIQSNDGSWSPPFHKSNDVEFPLDRLPSLPLTTNDVEISNSFLNDLNGSFRSPLPSPKVKKGLVRSQSYSAFRSSNTMNATKGMTHAAFEQHQTYFLKFIDLLIERETRSHYLEKNT